MNFLAHLVLAEPVSEALAGNFLGDFVKGRLEADRFPDKILQGIRIHRAVDAFTDSHPIPLLSRNLVPKSRRRLGGIIVDIAYDHFLCNNWEKFSDDDFETFVRTSYRAIEENAQYLPPKLRPVVPRMIEQDWLTCYRTTEGIDLTFQRISHRAPILAPMTQAMEDMEANYDTWEKHFVDFFPEVVEYVKEQRSQPKS